MVILSENDYLEVKLASLIADYDRITLTNLYQPIIGYTALAIYFTLWGEANNQSVSSLCSHSVLFNRMGISAGDFVANRKCLEAVGLVKSHLTSQGDTKFYFYEVFAPKTPKLFFDDTLLYGMLIKTIGDTAASKLKQMYSVEKNEEHGEDISSSFIDVFHPNFDDPAFSKALDNRDLSVARRSGKIDTEFSYEKFFDCIKNNSQILQDAFTKTDMKEIERLSTLNAIDEESAAQAVITIFNPNAGKGKHINFDELTRIFRDQGYYAFLVKNHNTKANRNSGDSDLASKINYMENTAPKKWLSTLQNGSKPANADLRLVEDISKDFGLTNSVINVLIDYVLSTNNNILGRSLTEKIAASLAREGVTTAIDAMNFLKKVKKSSTHTPHKEETRIYSKKVKEEKSEIETPIVSPKVEQEENDETSWAQLLDDIDEGGSDGKA